MSKKILAIFFLLLMINGVFASNIDPNRNLDNENLSFQSPTYSNLASGCYTEELPRDAVERLWREIIVNGFIVDTLSSDQPANHLRDELERNEVLITSEDSKAGDLVSKTEMPNQLMDPLELPSILGQTCYGPFSYGVDLEETVRIGRCQGDDTFACYLVGEGLFRQNGRYGFWPQTWSVGRDFLDMIGVKKLQQTGRELIDPELDYDSNVDLGLFSQMSYEELAMFRKYYFGDDSNLTEVEIKRLELVLDKSIQNSVLTESFNASMESTCSSENCYINMYSLFDKVFNQYYSADLVFTSISPLLWKFSGKVFQKLPKSAFGIDFVNPKSTGIIRGKNGFLDNLLNNRQNPFRAMQTSLKYRQISRNMDDYIGKLANKNQQIIQNINRYDMKPQFDKYLDALNSKKNIDTITNEFFKSGEFTKLNKSQQRVFMEAVMEYQDNIRAGRMIHEISNTNINNIITRDVTLPGGVTTTPKNILYDKTKNLDDFYSSLTHEQYTQLQEEVLRANRLNAEFSNFTTGKFKWDEGASDISFIRERVKTVPVAAGGTEDQMLNRVRVRTDANPTSIAESSGFKDILKKGDISAYETRRVPVNFADGPKEIELIVPYREQIGDIRNPIPNISQLDSFKKPDLMIEYQSRAGAVKRVRGSSIDISDIHETNPNLGYYTLRETPITDPAEIARYGIDPFEIKYSYFDNVGMDRLKDVELVNNNVMRVMSDQGWTDGRGLSYINQRMKQQQITKWDKRAIDIVADSAKAYGYNFIQWQMATAGHTIFGGAFDRYSMLRLPETYTSVIISHGDSADIYKDAYIDFFANDGSDQGDLFMQYFNSMIFWMVNLSKEILRNTEWETTQSISNWVTQFTEGHIRRSFTDNIAMFTNAIDNGCRDSSCLIKIGDSTFLEKQTLENSIDVNSVVPQNINNNFEISYNIGGPLKTTSYILENTSRDNFEKYGQTLISFSHHTDYDGSMGGLKTEDSVKLTTAIREEETCADKLKNLEFMGFPIGFTNTWTGKTYRTGLVAAGFSNIVYYSLSVPQHRIVLGLIFGNVVPQLVIVPEIYNCVDHEEGYYTHFFVAKEEYQRIEKDPKNRVGDIISKGSDSVEQALTNITKNTEIEESIKRTTQNVKNFAENTIKDNPIVQSRVETLGNTSSKVNGKLFFFELGENTICRASGYSDKGIEHLIDSEKKETLIIDKDKGEIKLVDEDGNITEIITSKNKDWVRLIATNLGIPAKVIPHRISYIPLPDTDTPLFNIDVFGNLKVDDPEFLNCLKQNYFEQTGLEMEGTVLTDYLGSVRQVVSTNNFRPETQYDIIPRGRQNSYEIVAEGDPRQLARGESARINILGDRTTKIFPVEGKEITLGKNISVQFERGQLIYHGESNSYIMWVQQTYKMHQSEIKGMDVTVNKDKNDVTGCDDFSFDMSVKPDDENPEAVRKAEEMNKALEKVGPFEMFDTPTKTFIFYTTDYPECDNRMKIIDKETGQVVDLSIDEIIQTPDGFIVKTEDGAEHKFAFSAEDGVPKLSYNDRTETLLSAQGKEGAFWYDPRTGNWYTENGHLIPFNPDYRDGITFKVGEDGKAQGTTIQNLMNPFAGQSARDRGTFNIPLTPEKTLPFALYMLIIIGSFLYLFQKKENIKYKRKKE